MKILLVEDEIKIREWVTKALRENGFVVDPVGEGNEAYQLLQTRSYDGAILDIMLPGRDGLSLLKSLRREGNNLSVVVLSARGEWGERVEGLNLGADDYLPKPFHIDELIARLRAVCRRSQGDHLNVVEAGPVRINVATREVLVLGEKLELTAREFSLLEMLVRSPGRVFTRTQILDRVWDYDFDPQTNLVDVYVKRLRQHLGEPSRDFIETVRGVGYRFRE
ncbi:winged helix-turn-helix domain-containing protein [Puniceicoccus vermicola]|uniref:Response regulator transcription factor n=1 Tax=Puniceicoccus vermicola TaxID=388746 RepID=A0A7X1AXV9_9BACT|nr:response regulator transcription factor [Puniceicoccus vermicola]